MEFFESLPPFVRQNVIRNERNVVRSATIGLHLESLGFFNFNELKRMEENLDDNESYCNLRKAVMEIILQYSAENNPFYNDKRLFDVFCIAISHYN
ncbi:unnamed protein product [Onchocerca flexuosa]|uniref:Uncharacterized protein n=1 Tax=Onchocerca flexuosa TaxID=387005 RepID=A0A183HPJ1_9BILA|nr:unnamed protein product [Onchocerca flexuosa]